MEAMFQIKPELGLLSPARYVISPNFDKRPPEGEISLLVVHNISLPCGQFGTPYIEALFTNRLPEVLTPSATDYPHDEQSRLALMEIANLRVSSHLVIDREGKVTQYVPFNQRAWHAGVSEFQGRGNCNDYSIGIELEGTDNVPYTDAQYKTLAAITELLMQYYPLITRERIVGHSDVAPGRKTDPGAAFDWNRFFSQLKI